MRVLKREFYNVSRTAETAYTLIPLGDVQMGSVACDEDLLKRVVDRIAGDDHCFWVGMGDYCEFINMADKHFDSKILADWLQLADLSDLAGAQIDHFLEIIKPIAPKCLGLLEGNHEQSIRAKYERDVYSAIVNGIKAAGGFPEDHKLALSFQGWIVFSFYWGAKKSGGSCTIYGSFHHGFVGGKLKGAKALNMERWLWSHACDFAVFGHSHNFDITTAGAEEIDRSGRVQTITRRGGYSGTFMRSINKDGPSLYTERRGYFPAPIGGVEIRLFPGARQQSQRVKMTV